MSLSSCLLVGFPRRCFRRLDLLLLTCCWLTWYFEFYNSLIVADWLLVIDWSSCQCSAALHTPRGTVISPLRTARWISPLRVQSPWLLFEPLVLYAQLPTEVLPNAAVQLIPVMHVARLCAATLPRCGTSSPCPKFTAEFKVRWSSVIPFCTRHSRSSETLFFSNLGLQTLFLSNRSSPRGYYANSPRIW